MAFSFNPGEALTTKYGPLPGYAWIGAIGVVGFLYIKSRQNRAGTLADPDADKDSGTFSSSVDTKNPDGSTTSYTASGPNSGFLGALTQYSAGPMGSSAGDVYVNLPGGGTTGKTLQTYKVTTGETLKTIAKKLFGTESAWRVLYRENATAIGSDPWKDLTGTILNIPDGNTDPRGGPHKDDQTPKYADTTVAQRDAIYAKYVDKDPGTLAKILDKWSAENLGLGTSAGKSLSIQQHDWADILRKKVGINSTRANV